MAINQVILTFAILLFTGCGASKPSGETNGSKNQSAATLSGNTVNALQNDHQDMLEEKIIEDKQLVMQSSPQNLSAKVFVDDEGYTVKDGVRIFPLGVFINSKNYTGREHLEQIASGGFNTVLCYDYGTSASPQVFLNNAKDFDLNVVFSLKGMYPKSIKGNIQPFVDGARRLINRVKDHDALLAWYINDELDPSWIPFIAEMYHTVKNNDLDHPVLQVLYQEEHLEKYNEVTDILAMVSYNVGNSVDLTQSSGRIKLTKKAMQNKGASWQIPQIYNHTVYNKAHYDAPTLDQMRNQAYQAIINGAKGLIFYSYSDLFREINPETKNVDPNYSQKRWNDVAAMGKELKRYEEVILYGKDASQHISIIDEQKIDVEISALEYRGDLYLFLANPYYEQKNIALKLSSSYNVIEYSTNDNISIESEHNAFKFTLESVASGVYKLSK